MLLRLSIGSSCRLLLHHGRSLCKTTTRRRLRRCLLLLLVLRSRLHHGLLLLRLLTILVVVHHSSLLMRLLLLSWRVLSKNAGLQLLWLLLLLLLLLWSALLSLSSIWRQLRLIWFVQKTVVVALHTPHGVVRWVHNKVGGLYRLISTTKSKESPINSTGLRCQ